MSCAMEYQQLAPPPVPAGVLHAQAHHPPQSQHQQQPVQPPQHPHIVVAPAHQQQSQQPPPPPLPPTSHGHQVHPPLPPIHDDSTSSRWTQYQHLWRQHHVYMNGRGLSLTRFEIRQIRRCLRNKSFSARSIDIKISVDILLSYVRHLSR